MLNRAESDGYRDAMVSLASMDHRVRGFLKYLLTGDDNCVSSVAFDRYLEDKTALVKDIGSYYELDREGVRSALLQGMDDLGIERVEEEGVE
jgi:hypothetical protein